MATIELDNLVKTYGDFKAVDAMSLNVAEGEFLVLLGPSGCGKTTTLKMIAGFIQASSGRILIDGRDVTQLPPHARNLGVVFQNYALFPHLSVYENVAFPLRRRKMANDEIDRRTKEALGLVQMESLATRMPRALSGGQQQRVAIARALSFQPDVLLLDEPLSNLDAKLRLEVRQQIRRLQQEMGITTIMVTHDQEEAMSVGDRLVVMKAGEVQQIGSSVDIYQRPANDFVASFIGSVNFLEGRLVGDEFVCTDNLRMPVGDMPSGTRKVVIRPEAISLHSDAPSSGFFLPATVVETVYLGPHSETLVSLAPELSITVRTQNHVGTKLSPGYKPGQPVYCSITRDAVYPLLD